MTASLLVGIDGSEYAERAADFAAEHAKRVSADLHLVGVIEWSNYSFLTPEELETRHKDRKEEEESANKVLRPIQERLAQDGLNVQASVYFGHAAKVLKEVAEEKGASQIFIGRHGRSRFETALFGSVTNKILQLAPVPVTVVP